MAHTGRAHFARVHRVLRQLPGADSAVAAAAAAAVVVVVVSAVCEWNGWVGTAECYKQTLANGRRPSEVGLAGGWRVLERRDQVLLASQRILLTP